MSEIIYISEDGIQREANSEELAQFDIDKAERASIKESIQAQNAARQSALAKLAALGLTEEEIAAL
jgi:DNA-binding NarL/FixJ family response regulator